MRKIIWIYLLCVIILVSGCASADAQADGTQLQANMAISQDTAPSKQTAAPAEVPSEEVRSDPYVYDGSKENLQTGGLTFFTFRQNTVSHEDERGEALLFEVLADTTFYSQCEIQNAWVNEILTDLHNSDIHYGTALLEYAKEDKKTSADAFYSHSHYVSRGVARHDDHVISLLSKTSVYSGGENYMLQTALNLDMVSLKSLTLEDVIYPDRVSALYDQLISAVEKKFSSLGAETLFRDYREIIADALVYGKMTPYWYFNQQGMVIFFNQYELTPYAAGIIKAELPYDTLKGILKEEYIPDLIEGWVSSLSIEDKNPENGQIYAVAFGEGETVYITLRGRATRVQLSDVVFAEQTAVSSTMLFSANRLDDTVTLAVTADPDPDKTYAVEYYDESAGSRIIYFRDNQIITDLKQ